MNLLEPVLTGIKSTNFFEGRLLTAQDLREQQTANEEHRWRLGRAIGSGVVEGLEVTLLNNGLVGSPPTLVPPKVRVDKGMAINGRGQALELTTEYVELELARELPAPDLADQTFNDCQPPTTSNIPNGEGVYLLVMSPALGFEDYAPKSGLGLEGKAIGCGRRYTVEGVQFRLEQIPLSSFDAITAPRNALRNLADTATSIETAQAVSQLRNAVAHSALNSASAAEQRGRIRSGEPVAFTTTSSILDTSALSVCDIPLAILFWDLTGVRFLDMWSVRRLARWLVEPDDIALFPQHGLEQLLQFIDHAREYIRPDLDTSNFDIRDLFRYIPPVGFVHVSRPGTVTGYNPDTFFADYTRGQPQAALAGRLSDMLLSSLAFGAVDLDDDTFLQTYEITENDEAVDAGDASSKYLVYATRDTNGPMTRDGVARTFEDAWEVYGGLIKNNTFSPTASEAANVVKLIVEATTGTALFDTYDLVINGFAVFANYDQNADGVLSAQQITNGINLQSSSTGVTAALSGSDLWLSAADGRDINIGQEFGGNAGGGIRLGIGGLQTGDGVTFRDGTVAVTTAMLRITGAVREVMDMANRQAAIALSNALDLTGAVHAFRQMHAVQREMTTLFQSTIPGIVDTRRREEFAAQVEQMLDVSLPSGEPGLEPTIVANDLVGAIDAQNVINNFVGKWTGEGVAAGPFGVTYRRSEQGVQLVPGEPPIPHVFELFNSTDRAVTIRVSAQITGAAGTWARPTVREFETGPDIDAFVLAQDTTREVLVMVGAPSNARVGDMPDLAVTASIDPPTNKSVTFNLRRTLLVDPSGGDPVDGVVEIAGIGASGIDLGDLVGAVQFTLVHIFRYTDSSPRDFRLEITVDSTTLDSWDFRDSVGDPLNVVSETTNQRVYSVDVNNVNPSTLLRRIEVQITPPAAAGSAVLSHVIRTNDGGSTLTDNFGEQTTDLVVQ